MKREDSDRDGPLGELEKLYGRGVTPASLLGLGIAVSKKPGRRQQRVIDAILAAEDQMRLAEEGQDDPSERAMWEAGRSTRSRRKKK